MCLGGCMITSKAKINIFWNFFFTPLAPSGPLRSKKFQKTLILAFEANSATTWTHIMEKKSETKIKKITHSDTLTYIHSFVRFVILCYDLDMSAIFLASGRASLPSTNSNELKDSRKVPYVWSFDMCMLYQYVRRYLRYMRSIRRQGSWVIRGHKGAEGKNDWKWFFCKKV